MLLSLRSLTVAVALSPFVAAPLLAQQGDAPRSTTPEAVTPAPAPAVLPVVTGDIAQRIAAADKPIVDAPVSPAPSTEQPATKSADTPEAAGPRSDVARVGIAPVTSAHLKDAVTTAQSGSHMGAGENVALMVVGGAAFVSGLIIGGGGGAAVAIGGAALGLWGLYNYVK